MMKFFLILLTTIFSFSSVIAQQLSPCGTDISAADMQNFYNRDITHLQKGAKAIVNIPVTYHLVADDNGNGAFTLSETFRLHCSMVEDFAPSEVVFYIHDIVYHNSDYYHYMEDNQAGNSMFNNENVANTCNIFIVEEAKSGTTPVCGYSYLASYGFFLNGNGIMLDKGCAAAGSTTLTHEMGHYLNLPHTFSGWENRDYFTNPINQNQWEKVNGSNCTTRGDGFCDTPPDYLSSRWDCNSFATLTDPDGQTFTADEKNFMSYSSDECMTYFMPEQQLEVNAASASYRPYLLTLTTPDLSPVPASTTVFPADNETDLSSNSITFTWTASPGAEAYLVEFTQGNFFNVLKSESVTTNSITLTDLNPNATYKWRVKAYTLANVCTDFSAEQTFSTATFNTSANPVDVFCTGDENGTVTVNSDDVASLYTLFEYDNINQTYNQVSVSTTNSFSNLAPNEYMVEVTSNAGDNSKTYFSVEDASPITIQLNLVGNSITSNVFGGTPPYNYIWSNGVNGISNNMPSAGENLLYISDQNGCFKSASIEYGDNSNPSTAINELNALNFNLYPNPISGDYLFIEFSDNNTENAIIEFYSVSGQRVNELNSKKQNNIFSEKINISELSKGVYFIKITAGDKSSTRKIIL